MEKSFLEYYDFYEGVCKERLHLQGKNMQVLCIGIYLNRALELSKIKNCKEKK